MVQVLKSFYFFSLRYFDFNFDVVITIITVASREVYRLSSICVKLPCCPREVHQGLLRLLRTGDLMHTRQALALLFPLRNLRQENSERPRVIQTFYVRACVCTCRVRGGKSVQGNFTPLFALGSSNMTKAASPSGQPVSFLSFLLDFNPAFARFVLRRKLLFTDG